MKKVLCILALCFSLAACKGDCPDQPDNTRQTLFMYLPWSGNSTASGGDYNLYSYFITNINDLKIAIQANGLNSERVLVFLSTSPTRAALFEIKYQNGTCTTDTLKRYTDPPFTTVGGITSILQDVSTLAPSNTYSMVIGCHGMGWLPVQAGRARGADQKMHWEYEGALLTRYFGGAEAKYQTEIGTLADAIANTGTIMEYILFDDCYLSTIEVAYELKDVTKYIIACPTEIMAYGMPYSLIGKYLLGNPDYEGIVDTFFDFYNTYSYPYGTIGVTNCSELDNMAAIMKEINTNDTFDDLLLNSIQQMDGYTPTIFFDFADYVSKLCTNTDLSDRFNAQLERTVPYKRNTEYYYSASSGARKINTYSGTTISDPSQNSKADAKSETLWYKATH